jgi:hypothetical protein
MPRLKELQSLLFLGGVGVAFILLTSCGDDPVLPLTPNQISELKAYDLNNNGNSSDIRVNFEVTDNLNVHEYRIMIIPAASSSSFQKSTAASVPEASFFKVFPEGLKNKYSIGSLPFSLLDVYGDKIQGYSEFVRPILDANGEPIRHYLEYVATVFVLGVGDTQLSEFSRPFKLKNQGIYCGEYAIGGKGECWSTIDDNILYNDYSNWDSPANDAHSIVIMGSATKYFAIQKYEVGPEEWHTKDTIHISVNGSTISDYAFQTLRYGCVDLQCDQIDTCSIMEKGQGLIIDDLRMEITYTRENCNNYCEGKLLYVRK